MAWGLRTFNSSGIQLDTSEGVFTILGYKTYTLTSWYDGGPSSGSFSDGNLTKGTPFFFIVDIPQDATYGTGLVTHITFSGTTCSWSVDASPYGFGSPDQSGTLSFYYGYF